MMTKERNLRLIILLMYGIAIGHMLWTGVIYRFVGHSFFIFEVGAFVLIWLLILASLLSFRVPDNAKENDAMTAGILYALFALPAVIYLIAVFMPL